MNNEFDDLINRVCGFVPRPAWPGESAMDYRAYIMQKLLPIQSEAYGLRSKRSKEEKFRKGIAEAVGKLFPENREDVSPPDIYGWGKTWAASEGGWIYFKIYPEGTLVSELPNGGEIKRVFSDGTPRS